MLVSWNWLKEYVTMDMAQAELEDRLSMSGLNHEGSKVVDDDVAIDLEVTSNRSDCLGHVGVAREIAVLWDHPLRIPKADLPAGNTPVSEITRVTVHCNDLCRRYTARVIRGVKIGPSPQWLVSRLRTVGIATVNNVVDITNYVLMETGQPLHAFDLQELAGPEIIVREANAEEKFAAINHKTYELTSGMCVIADAQRAIALGGVMGGANTEVSDATTDLLIESADFAQLPIRTTARRLNLHSPSSYRFERGVDPLGVDWASRRCCELILELAGGELADGVIDVGQDIGVREPVELRLAQVPRVLGIDVPSTEVRKILKELGCQEDAVSETEISVVPPSWRNDLTREIDLIEEIARIYGYDRIPEDVGVPMAPSHRSREDRVLNKIRHALTAAGFDESLSASVVPEQWTNIFSPWSDAAPIKASTPMLKGADYLRRSLVASLLDVRRINESLSNPVIELFETARVYLPSGAALPHEQDTLAITSGGDYFQIKGVIEAIVTTLNPSVVIGVHETDHQLLDQAKSSRLSINDRTLGFVGEVADAGLQQFNLRGPTTVAEIDLSVLFDVAELVPRHVDQSPYPAIDRDLNMIVADDLRWSALAETVLGAAGECLESLRYQETYRDPKKDGSDKKRLLFSIVLRSSDRTLTNEEADAIRDQVVAACSACHQAELLGG